MGYPQQSSNDAATGGQNVFRLSTQLVSPGDIYQSDQGGHAFAVGPDSDLANIGVVFYDPQSAPTFVDQIAISPSRAYIGLIPARGDVTYQPSKRKGRTLFYSLDLYDPAYRPPGFSAVQDFIQFHTPVMEVLQYFAPQASITPARNDKTFYFQDLPSIPGHSSYVVLPYYGRKFLFMNYTNKTAGNIDVTLVGVNFAVCDNTGTVLHQENPLYSATVASGTTKKFAMGPGEPFAVGGMFDVVVFKSTQSGGSGGFPTPLKIVVSDDCCNAPGS